jgi:glycosyltransferase involved in cell wall biosynthesis
MIRLIIPAFNEGEPLESLLPRLPTELSGHQVMTLVVSDGSTDNTVEVARAAGVEVLTLESNRGKGTAVREALASIEELEHDIVVLMDADGQHDPEDLASLVAPLIAGDADIAVGSRYAEDERRGNTPRNRYAVRWTTVALLKRILGTRFTDPYCGFRAFKTASLEVVEFCGSRYEGELEILFDACRCGLRVAEVPVRKIYGQGMSKMSADGGRILGRLRVIRQYAVTIGRKRRELRSSPEPTRQISTG